MAPQKGDYCRRRAGGCAMTTDFRALCAELVEQLDDALDFTVSGETKRHMKLLTQRARAALAEADGPAVPDGREPASVNTEPSGPIPADDEVTELATAEMVRQLRTKAATEKANRCHYSAKLLTRAADLLERQHPESVPVSERLPEPEDCDAEGRCWAWNPDPPDDDEEGSWVLLPWDWGASPWTTHWLPAHALPVPNHTSENV